MDISDFFAGINAGPLTDLEASKSEAMPEAPEIKSAGVFRVKQGETLRPGYYWCRTGNWELIFIYLDGKVDSRATVHSGASADLFLSCDLAGPVEPPDDIGSHRAWCMRARTAGNETYFEER